MGWGLGGRLGPDHGDPVFYVYLMKWVASRLPHGLAGLWDPPFYHPLPGVLALSDHFVGPGIAFAALRAIGLEPLEASNLLYASAFALAGVSSWWVLRRSGVSGIGAAFGAWFFAFGHFRWDDQSHFNLLRIAWIPLVLWTFDRLLESPSWRRAAAFGSCYALHLAGSVYLAYLVHVPIAVLALNRRREIAGLRRRPRAALPLVAAAGLAAMLLAVLFAGYSGRARVLNAERDLRELRAHAPTLSAFVAVSAGAPIERAMPWIAALEPRAGLFPGFAVLCAATVAGVAGWRRFRRPAVRAPDAPALGALGAGGALVVAALVAQDRFTLGLDGSFLGLSMRDYRLPLIGLIVGSALIVAGLRRRSAGPAFEAGSMPAWPRGLLLAGAVSLAACLPALFWLLWKNLPGMSGMRVPHRFFPFVALALAFAAGSGLDLLRRRTRSGAARGLLVAAFSVVIVVEQLPRLRSWMPYPEEPDFPPYSRFLAGAADVSSYVELPMFGDWHDLTTMYLGTSHWKPLVNGSSSYLPYERELLTRACARIDPECLDRLRAWRVSHLVARYWMPEDVRGKRRRKADRKEFLSWGPRLAELERSGLLVRVFADELGSVYRFDWERAVDQPAAASAPRDAAASSRASGTVN